MGERRGAVGRPAMLAAALVLGLGSFLIGGGAAWAVPRGNSLVVIRFSSDQVTLKVPSRPCPMTRPDCQWMLFVNEPDTPTGTVVGRAVGTSGVLTVDFPPGLCDVVIQADALIGPTPWMFRAGHKRTINDNSDCTSPATPPPATPPPAVTAATQPAPTSPSPSTGAPATSAPATPAPQPAAPAAPTTTTIQLPFTGVNVTPLALIGSALVLIGVLTISTFEQRRRALRRAAANNRVRCSRFTWWLLGD